METLPPGKIRFIPLGGVGEIGKNLYAYHVLDQILIVDCGLKFPDERMFGVDIVIPDVRYLVENKDAIQAILITHGHEDHIGGLGYIAPQLPGVPIYGPPLALGLAKNRLKERGVMNTVSLNEFGPEDVLQLGHFVVEPIRVAHSIPDSFAFFIRTPAGNIVHTGDFKFDQTPVDNQLFDLGKLSRLSEEGVLALVSDTTNIERPGYVPTERIVGETFARVFADAPGRVIIASFASQIHRMQMACDVAVKQGRKVAAVGRSMQQNFDMAMQMGYLTVPEGLRIRAEDIGQYPPHEIAIVTTGSQGEPLAGLSRMANDDHRHVRIQKGDTVVLSATPIPGNEDAVWRVVNNLIARGADVIYDAIMPVHVSGHGYAEELKLVLNVTDPQYVIPVHGEPRMLLRYSKTAQQMGWLPEDIFRLEIGDVLELDLDHGKIVDRVASGSVLVDGGSGSTGVHEVVLRDRQHLAEDGFVVVVAAISAEDGALMSGPEILTRGFVYVDQSEDLLTEATEIIREQLLKLSGTASRDLDAIQGDIRATLRKLFEKRTNRRPLVMPLILEY